jgi:preprotein translocase subunit SecF
MQLLSKTNIDFLGYRKTFIGLSLVLMLAGVVSTALNGGLKFGIDFKGGTLVYVKFKDAPNVDAVRAALSSKGLSVATLQPFTEGPNSHELKIDLDLAGDIVETSGKAQVIETLRDLYPLDSEKLDFNNTGIDSLVQALYGSAKVQSAGLTREEVTQQAEALLEARDEEHSGLVNNFSELASVSGVNPDTMTALQEETALGGFAIRGIEVVGPRIGKQLQWVAIRATLFALVGMLIYIAFRFEWIYGVAAVVAVFHDVFITLGFFSIFGREIELTVIVALLTLVGYSMNDTIVIFDRVRENRKLTRRLSLLELLNLSINQTLSRTILTSGLTLIAVLCLLIFGGEVLRGLSFALVVGVLVGTYSSIFIASPILLWGQGLLAVKVPNEKRARRN